MKLLIALAAVLSSAALTVPTVTNVANARSADSRQVAAVTAFDTNNANG